MPIFYYHIKKDAQEIAVEEKTLIHHLRDVMRAGKNESIRFFDNNYIYVTKVKEVTKTKIVCHIERKQELSNSYQKFQLSNPLLNPNY